MEKMIDIEKQMFLSNEMTKLYFSANMLTSFQEFSSDYIENYNSVKTFLFNERLKSMKSSLSFDTFENNYSFLLLASDEAIEQFASKIVNKYYSSGNLSNINYFASDYLNNFALAMNLLYNEKQKEEQAINSFEGFENVCHAIRLLNREGIEHLSTQIVNTYYSSGRLGNFNEFASEYINNYRSASKIAINNKGEMSVNSKLSR